jgi:hypothetical protein
LWDGGYYSEKHPTDSSKEDDDLIFKYSEQEYIEKRFDKEVSIVPAFNQMFVENNNGVNQLYYKKTSGSYEPVNYSNLGYGNDAWHQDYGFKFLERTKQMVEDESGSFINVEHM